MALRLSNSFSLAVLGCFAESLGASTSVIRWLAVAVDLIRVVT